MDAEFERLQYRYADTANFKGWITDGYRTPAGAFLLLADADGDTREVSAAELVPAGNAIAKALQIPTGSEAAGEAPGGALND